MLEPAAPCRPAHCPSPAVFSSFLFLLWRRSGHCLVLGCVPKLLRRPHVARALVPPYREHERKDAAAPHFALDLDASAVRFNDALRNGEPEPDSATVASLRLPELSEQSGNLRRRNARASVDHGVLHFAVGASG